MGGVKIKKKYNLNSMISLPQKLENVPRYDFSSFKTFKSEEKFSKFVKIASGPTHHAAIDQQGCLYTWGQKLYILKLFISFIYSINNNKVRIPAVDNAFL